MAVDVCSENFISINSPSFSFSNDLQENETKINSFNGFSPCKLDHSLIDSTFDFAFNVDKNISFQSSTADELFSDGKILPTSVRKKDVLKKVKHEILSVPCLDSQCSNSPFEFEPKKKSLKEFLEDSSEEEEQEQELETNMVVTAKPFWKFRRSSSLNCNNHKKGLLIGSWNNILSRSGSTGKFLEKILEENEVKPNNNVRFSWKFSKSSSDKNVNVHNNVGYKKGENFTSEVLRRSNSTNDHYSSKPGPKPIRRSNSTGSAPNHVRHKKHQQEQIKGKVKNVKEYSFGNYYSNSGKLSPILNLPSPYISRVSVDLFGMGSLFCNGSIKDRKKKK